MKNLKELLLIAANFMLALRNINHEGVQDAEKSKKSLKKEFATLLLGVTVYLFLIILLVVSIASISNQVSDLLLIYENGLLFFFLFHGSLLIGSVVGIMMFFKSEFSIKKNEDPDQKKQPEESIDGRRLAATFFVGFVEGWQSVPNNADL